MNVSDLYPFQIKASTQIADRFRCYMEDPLTITRTKIVPFYQNLHALTGAGKTVILADTIEQLRSVLPVEPIVLWLSKGKVVVEQTYANLSGGKYAELLGGYTVKPLRECAPDDIENATIGLVLVATVGKFNQKDKEQGDRKIFQVELDNADKSLWDLLKFRHDGSERRRPFIVVYDEGHNLSNQQTELLLELEPDALIAASATSRIPEALGKVINRLREDKHWTDNHLMTTVTSSDVVESGLIKSHVLLGGYITPMETAIDDLLKDMTSIENDAHELGVPLRPQAIYVSNTNVVGGTGQKDRPAMPFKERLARPILIWRHLVETRGVDPAEIAVYCDLKFDKKFPPPKEFNLFSGGDADYEAFQSGNFKHIIFNLTLQEGWDDPACYLAYIDKDMGSKVQVTQIMGRVLRQPNAQHYRLSSLNTARFYVRTDEKQVFEDVLQEVRQQIAVDSPEITLDIYRSGPSSSPRPVLLPKKKRYLPEVSIDSTAAMVPIKAIIDNIDDYRFDPINTVGTGRRISVLQTIGAGSVAHEEWIDLDHSNRVTARWVFIREIQKYHKKAVNLCDIEETKFDALIEYNSRAALHIRESAEKVVDAYIKHSHIIQNNMAQFLVPEILANQANMTSFRNAVHDSYGGLNALEKRFAEAIDDTKRVWFRNPSRGCFEIPLLDKGGTNNFNPDFLVWTDKTLVAIDTKGDHLIVSDAGRKLLHMKKLGNGPNLVVRLVTEGEWSSEISKIGNDGFTVWTLRNGRVHPVHCGAINDAVRVCLELEF